MARGGKGDMKGGVCRDGPSQVYNILTKGPISQFDNQLKEVGIANIQKNTMEPNTMKIPKITNFPSTTLGKQNQLPSTFRSRNHHGSNNQTASDSSGREASVNHMSAEAETCSRNPPSR
ncbi:hypothetical protein A2U01_0059657, partial [Trifolium medium]|nr:hypothetical protein [Trifolium medium]